MHRVLQLVERGQPAPLALWLLLASACLAESAPESSEQTAARDARTCQGGRLALTFDDLPWNGPAASHEHVESGVERILAALERAGAPATGFVVCGQVPGREAILNRWLAAGHELGNHSAAHRDLDRSDLGQWLADVESCHGMLSRLTESRFFRFPYLHQGATPGRRAEAQELLERLGNQVAHVSVDNSEWILARHYRELDPVAAPDQSAQVGALFVEHILETLDHYRAVARDKGGRDVTHVLLLHANALVADHIGTLLDALLARSVCFVPLEQALDDPIYAGRDGYVGPKGLSWLYRVEPATPQGVAWDDARADALEAKLRSLASGPNGTTASARSPVSLPRTETLELRSAHTGVDYEIQVALPPSYDPGGDARYPVIYLLDAGYSFAIARNVTEHLSDRGGLVETILVGIAYAGPPQYRVHRTRDYTPTFVPDGGYGPEIQRHSGGAERFRRFMADELIPVIDRSYRTVMGDRTLVGHSYGGLFGAWLLVTEPEIFSRYLLVSPSLWYDDHLVPEALARVTDTRRRSSRASARVYLGVGSRERNTQRDMVRDLQAFADQLEAGGVEALASHVFDDDTHDSVFPAAFTSGVHFLFEGR